MSGDQASPQLFVSDFAFQPPDRERLEAALSSDSLLLVRGPDALKQALESHPQADVVCAFSLQRTSMSWPRTSAGSP